jgi:hypothetical protein
MSKNETRLAVAAEDNTFQVMVMRLVVDLCPRVRLHHRLNLEKHLRPDQAIMAAFVDLAAINDVALVVRVH